jgi:asparagine synthase (glutamine-hydrolysing)
MCGICGVFAASEGEDVTNALERLTDALPHRGPDGCGFRFVRGRSAGLGHRRLSIVDLVTGGQPMANEDERVWVTHNGEIYNHRELRSELAALGHRFRTSADTEVLVHGFEAWGSGLFGRLNGMYAFALFDGRTAPGELWLVRDPAGVEGLIESAAGSVFEGALPAYALAIPLGIALARSSASVSVEARAGAVVAASPPTAP